MTEERLRQLEATLTPSLGDMDELCAEIRRLNNDNDRLKKANEHWHERVEQLKTEVEAYQAKEDSSNG